MWYACTMEYYLAMKEGNPIIWDSWMNMEDIYGKWIKPGTERQMPHDLTPVEFKQLMQTESKMVIIRAGLVWSGVRVETC